VARPAHRHGPDVEPAHELRGLLKRGVGTDAFDASGHHLVHSHHEPPRLVWSAAPARPRSRPRGARDGWRLTPAPKARARRGGARTTAPPSARRAPGRPAPRTDASRRARSRGPRPLAAARATGE